MIYVDEIRNGASQEWQALCNSALYYFQGSESAFYIFLRGEKVLLDKYEVFRPLFQ
jgi:hypothetical protein